jgi:hypothetical protein
MQPAQGVDIQGSGLLPARTGEYIYNINGSGGGLQDTEN